jgi:hypothetical protein
MKLLDAAERVLREASKSLHSREIVAYAKKRGWIAPRGRTPDHSLQAAIWKDIKALGSRSRFVVSGRGSVDRKYSLRSRC